MEAPVTTPVPSIQPEAVPAPEPAAVAEPPLQQPYEPAKHEQVQCITDHLHLAA